MFSKINIQRLIGGGGGNIKGNIGGKNFLKKKKNIYVLQIDKTPPKNHN
jgi:hypothetical protein